jgi:hypothetical protein
MDQKESEENRFAKTSRREKRKLLQNVKSNFCLYTIPCWINQ